jgi:predicted metal-dependent hydrolase
MILFYTLIKMDINFKVKYSNRRTFGLVIDRDKTIYVNAPNGVKKEKINNFIDKKRSWIYHKLNNKQKFRDISEKEFVSGSSILYLGRNYNLDVNTYKHEGIKFNGKFLLSTKEKNNVNNLFKEWFIQKANEKIIPLVEENAKKLGVNYNLAKIKEIKYCWGSCTPKNNLYFNWRLIKAPLSVINYVIMHELTHLIESNHTKRFWNIIKSQQPNYEKAKYWLKENGQILENTFKTF